MIYTARWTALASILILCLAAPLGAQTLLARTDVSANDAAGRLERETYAMGTRLSLETRGPEAAAAAEAAQAMVRRVEDLLSTWRDDTELSALNRAPAGVARPVSPALLAVLEEVGGWVRATEHAFDPAIGPLVDAWGLRGEGGEPSMSELAAARRASGWEHLVVEPSRRTVTRTTPDVWIDAGAFGKGLALREAAAALRSAGGSGALNFGGQVMVVGSRPVAVGVAHARVRDRDVATLTLADASAATTSTSERGRHLLDPRTGRLVSDWGSVTVVAEDPMVADLLSTALYVMGPEAALAWAADRPYGVLVQEAGDSEPPVMRWNAAMAQWLTRRDGEPGLPPADTSEIERLKRQVDAITRELERLRLGSDVVAQADTGAPGFGPAASKVYRSNEGVSIGGYGEIEYAMPSDRLEDGTASPAASQWDAHRAILYFGYKFSDRLLVNTEIELEHADEAWLEFAYLDYRLNDALGFRGGLLLSPMGLINELHEPPTFLGSTRPLVTGSIIPTTWRENGFGIFGDLGAFSYRAYIMNGLDGAGAFDDGGLRGGRQKGSHALAEDVAGVVRVDYTGVPGLLAGGSVYYGGSGQGRSVTLDGTDREIQANTLIWEGHVSYQARGLDLRGVVAGASVEDALLLNAYRAAEANGLPGISTALTQTLTGGASVGESMLGGYAHAGYDVLRGRGTSQQLIPYVRYEFVNTQTTVPEGFSANPAQERTALLLGAAWKPVPQVALKADYQLHSTQADTGRNQLVVVLAYLF
jgi:thiamine biosynthesis lipoprotein ApbE